MTTRSELLYGALLLLIALIARSVSRSMSMSFLRDAVSMLSVVMLIGGVIVVVGLWHAARRADLLTAWQGFGVFAVWTTALILVSGYLLNRRDA